MLASEVGSLEASSFSPSLEINPLSSSSDLDRELNMDMEMHSDDGSHQGIGRSSREGSDDWSWTEGGDLDNLNQVKEEENSEGDDGWARQRESSPGRGFDWRYDIESESGSEYGESSRYGVRGRTSRFGSRGKKRGIRKLGGRFGGPGLKSSGKAGPFQRQQRTSRVGRKQLTIRVPTPPLQEPARSLSGSEYELELHNDDDDETRSPNSKSPLDKARAQLQMEQQARQRPPPTLPEGIVIRGSGLTSKDKDDIQRTLGDLEKIQVEGLKDQWLSRKNLNQYFYYCAERQRIYDKKTADPAGTQAPWTEDQIFANMKISNIYRNQDRTSKFVIDEIINNYKYDPLPGPEAMSEDPRWSSDGVFIDTVEEVSFRILLFWQFGKKQTWDALRSFMKENYGTDDIRYADYEEKIYKDCLRKQLDTGECLFTGAYQIHPSKTYGAKENFVNGEWLESC